MIFSSTLAFATPSSLGKKLRDLYNYENEIRAILEGINNSGGNVAFLELTASEGGNVD